MDVPCSTASKYPHGVTQVPAAAAEIRGRPHGSTRAPPPRRLRAAFVALSTVCALLFTTLSPAARADPDPSPGAVEPPTARSRHHPAAAERRPDDPVPRLRVTEEPAAAEGPQRSRCTVSDVPVSASTGRATAPASWSSRCRTVGEIPETITGVLQLPQRHPGHRRRTAPTAAPSAAGTPELQLPARPGQDRPRGGHRRRRAPNAWRRSGRRQRDRGDGRASRGKCRNFCDRLQHQAAGARASSSSPTARRSRRRPSRTRRTRHSQVKLRNTGSDEGRGRGRGGHPAGCRRGVASPAPARCKKQLSPSGTAASWATSPQAGTSRRLRAGDQRVRAGRGAAAGAVHGYLAPIGRDVIETRADYTISGPPLAGESPLRPGAGVAGGVAVAASTDTAKASGPPGGLRPAIRCPACRSSAGIIGLVALVSGSWWCSRCADACATTDGLVTGPR